MHGTPKKKECKRGSDWLSSAAEATVSNYGDMRCLNEVERKRRLSLDAQSVCDDRSRASLEDMEHSDVRI